jgi:hypothetical protein
MAEFTDPARPPDPNGPWLTVTGVDQLFDHGRPWCANAAGHPSGDQSYPDAAVHVPVECRSQSLFVDDNRQDLHGASMELEVYVAAPFRFGWARSHGYRPSRAPRIVFEFGDDAVDQPELATRFSVCVAAAALQRRLSTHRTGSGPARSCPVMSGAVTPRMLG